MLPSNIPLGISIILSYKQLRINRCRKSSLPNKFPFEEGPLPFPTPTPTQDKSTSPNNLAFYAPESLKSFSFLKKGIEAPLTV